MNHHSKLAKFQALVNTWLAPVVPDLAQVMAEPMVGKTTGYRLRAEFSIYHDNINSILANPDHPELHQYQVHHCTFDKEIGQRVFWQQYPLACPLINAAMPVVKAFCERHYSFAKKLFQVEYLTSMQGQIIVSLIFHRRLDEHDHHYAQLLQQQLLELAPVQTTPLGTYLQAHPQADEQVLTHDATAAVMADLSMCPPLLKIPANASLVASKTTAQTVSMPGQVKRRQQTPNLSGKQTYQSQVIKDAEGKPVEFATSAAASVILRARKDVYICGDNYLLETFTVNDHQYQLLQVENSFSQPNGEINQQMLGFVEQFIDASRDVLELYCGVGNFTMILGQACKAQGRRVLATEVNKQAIDFAYQNLALNDLSNVDLGRVSAEEFVEAIQHVRPFRRLQHIDLRSYDFGTVFVDPPRSGLDEKSCDMLANYDHIIYVSCNPETLMPNLQYLIRKHGYHLQVIKAFDQFPQTPHMETIALLQKANT